MSWVSWLAIYFILWWLCLFVALPFGVRNQHDIGEIVEGTEPGAPAVLKLWPRLLATTLVSAVLLVGVMWLLSNPAVQEYWR